MVLLCVLSAAEPLNIRSIYTYQGGIVVGIQAIMGAVEAGSAIAAVAQSAAKKRAIPVAVTTLNAALDADRPPATASKKE
jgi:hypothetical protein